MALFLPDHNALLLDIPETGAAVWRWMFHSHVHVITIEKGAAHALADHTGTTTHRNQPRVFMTVRQPASWYGAYWHLKQANRRGDNPWFYWDHDASWHPTWRIDPACGADTFEEFVGNIHRRGGFLAGLFEQYEKSVFWDRATIGRYETLWADLTTWLGEIGIDVNATRVAAALPPRFLSVPDAGLFSPEVTRTIADMEAEVYARFGYSHEPMLEPMTIAPQEANDE